MPITTMFASSSNPAISVHIPSALHVTGSPIEGAVELDFRHLQQDGIQEVHVKLRGFAKTMINRDKTTMLETFPLVRDDASLWCQGGAYPLPGSDILRIPFRLQLPPELPPSFQYVGGARTRSAAIRYSVTAVGVRPGAFHFNRRVRVPLALVPRDAIGIKAKEELALMVASAEPRWKTEFREEKIRRGLWGDYATVQVQLSIADVPVYPLFVPIPFKIHVKTVTAPLTRAKADAHPPDKPVFPPAPASYGQVEFKLRQKLFIRARSFKEKPTADVTTFGSDPSSVMEVDLPEKEWVPLEGDGKEKGGPDPDGKGTWVQRATFQSTFRLDCPPTFGIETIKTEYFLSLKVPFPGLGNNVTVTMPITITSGIDATLARDQPGEGGVSSPPGFLDLPPAYWDPENREWDNEKD